MSDSSAIVPAVDGKRSTKVKLLLFGTGRGNIIGRVNNILFSDFGARFLGLELHYFTVSPVWHTFGFTGTAQIRISFALR